MILTAFHYWIHAADVLLREHINTPGDIKYRISDGNTTWLPLHEKNLPVFDLILT